MHAILPLKDLVDAKTRLAGVLRPAERRALAQAMVEDVLSVVSDHPRLESLVLLSDDPSAAMLAERFGVRHRSERSFGVRGLNPLLEACRQSLADTGRLLVLHGDIPLLSAADLDEVFAASHAGTGVIGSDRHGSGTNLLSLPGNSGAPFCFGADSCQRHRDSLRRAGLEPVVLQRPGLGLDVDLPDDLLLLCQELEQRRANSATALWLRDSGVLSRTKAMLEGPGKTDSSQHSHGEHQ